MNRVVVYTLALSALAACGSPHTTSNFSDVEPTRADQFVWHTQEAPDLKAPGPGAGEWNSEPRRPDNVMLAEAAKAYLSSNAARQRYGAEAAGSFRHYFDNDGIDYTVAVAKLIADVPRVGELYQELTADLLTVANQLEPGSYDFSTREARTYSIARAESENWYLAVAGFSYWISGWVEVGADQLLSGQVQFNLWDRYDWDPGTVIPISTPFGTINIDQDRVGEFHRQGLAKEFDTRGAAVRQIP